MKGKIFLFLFALPFFGVGVWMGYSVVSSLASASQMKQWHAVDATLTRAGYETHSGDDSDTYEAFAEYNYSFGGQSYRNDRVSLTTGSDNIGDYQTDLGNRLRGALQSGRPVVVYVNPDDPAESIIDRTLRWGLLGFNAIFLFTFGGVGLGLIIYVVRAPKEKDLAAPEYRERPWLANDAWQTALVKSSSKMAMYVAWGFAAFWNLISAPLPFVIFDEVLEKDNIIALVGLLFPLVGVGLITWAVRRTLEWNRFGPAPVMLDPYPGSIGGHVGGTIDVKLPFEAGTRFSVTLSNLRSYVSGTGKNRSRKESAEWQDTQVAHVASGSQGTRLSFRFEVPESLRESDADKSAEVYYIWRLNVKAELAGVDIDRDYEIPVYATRQNSSQLSEFSIQEARAEQNTIDLEAIRKLLHLGYDAGGRAMHYPMGRNLLSGFSGLIFGAVFAGTGWFLIRYESHPIMGSVFGAVGLLILVSALYYVLNSLDVVQVGGDIRTVRRVLGIPVRRSHMRRADFVRFGKKVSSKTQSGGKHVINYSVHAVDRAGQKMIVGEGFKGAGQADAAANFIARQFGLSPQRGSALVDANTGEYNLLTSD